MTVDCGLWTVDSGLWTVDSHQMLNRLAQASITEHCYSRQLLCIMQQNSIDVLQVSKLSRLSPVRSLCKGPDNAVCDDIQHDIRQVHHDICETVNVGAIVLCLQESHM